MRPCDRRLAPSFKNTRARGLYGEQVASSFLRRHGYKILYRNFRIRRGEIDLVCRHGEVLAFVEVKARASDRFGQPSEAVNPAKARRNSLAAVEYLKMLGRENILFRFDIVEVFLQEGELPQCRLIENAHSLAPGLQYRF